MHRRPPHSLIHQAIVRSITQTTVEQRRENRDSTRHPAFQLHPLHRINWANSSLKFWSKCLAFFHSSRRTRVSPLVARCLLGLLMLSSVTPVMGDQFYDFEGKIGSKAQQSEPPIRFTGKMRVWNGQHKYYWWIGALLVNILGAIMFARYQYYIFNKIECRVLRAMRMERLQDNFNKDFWTYKARAEYRNRGMKYQEQHGQLEVVSSDDVAGRSGQCDYLYLDDE